MATPSLQHGSVLIGESSPLLRQAARIALHAMGMKKIEEVASLSGVYAALRENVFDLVILNSDLDNSDAFFVVRELRNGRLGDNIFAGVVLLLTKKDEFHVKGAVNCGADSALLVPFAPDQLMARVTALAERRQPFVVTHDYIGPERRKQARPDNSAASFAVPNPLQPRATAAMENRYRAVVDHVRSRIFAERVKRLASHLEWGSRDLVARSRDGMLTSDYSIPSLFALETASEELVDRLRRDGADIAQLENVRDICSGLKSGAGKAAHADFETLHQEARRVASRFAA